MPLTDLITALEAEAEDELAQRRASDEAEAGRILAVARAEAADLVTEARERAEAAATARAARDVARARMEVAADLRRDREDALDAVRRAAVARLAGLRDRPDHADVLRGLLREALTALPAAGSVHADPRDAVVVKALLDELGCTAELVADLRTAGGVAVRGGGRRVDNTVETRLASGWPHHRVALNRAWTAELAVSTDTGAGP